MPAASHRHRRRRPRRRWRPNIEDFRRLVIISTLVAKAEAVATATFETGQDAQNTGDQLAERSARPQRKPSKAVSVSCGAPLRPAVRGGE
ncbi:hypothetical protein ACQFN5_05990 [Klebsiella sp. WOUb02]|uniref:hypothetical protein n=1 Tax=Klebsiella sp. WOUb02 TaxID=3161071 RepID=UPI003D08FDFA